MSYVPAFPKPARLRDPEYLAWVRKRPCLVCGAVAQTHHARTKGSGGSDYRVLPLCYKHHDQVHKLGRATFESVHHLSMQEEVIRLLESYIAAGRP